MKVAKTVVGLGLCCGKTYTLMHWVRILLWFQQGETERLLNPLRSPGKRQAGIHTRWGTASYYWPLSIIARQAHARPTQTAVLAHNSGGPFHHHDHVASSVIL